MTARRCPERRAAGMRMASAAGSGPGSVASYSSRASGVTAIVPVVTKRARYALSGPPGSGVTWLASPSAASATRARCSAPPAPRQVARQPGSGWSVA